MDKKKNKCFFMIKKILSPIICAVRKMYITFFSIHFPIVATRILYKRCFKKSLSLNNPQTINEKIQFLKLFVYNDNEIITKCCDKYLVRDYLKNYGYSNLLPELYGVYNNPYDIPWDSLPNRFVIKCNHGSGYNIIVKDKMKINKDEYIILLNRWLKEDYWTLFSELQYKNIDKKIIIEEYLGENITTYKFYCFNGIPKILYIGNNYSADYGDYYCFDFYDEKFHHLNIKLHGHTSGYLNKKPNNFEDLLQISKALSSPFPFVRIDLYNIYEKIYFSEFTFIPTGGFMKFEPEDTDMKLGKMLDISNYM